MPTRIDDLLRMAMSFGASDLHLRAGSFPVIRVSGELRPVSGVSRLAQEETLEMAFSMMSNRQKQHFKEAFEVDLGYSVSGLGRFRVNIFHSAARSALSPRVIPDPIRHFAELAAAGSVEIAEETAGLFSPGTTGRETRRRRGVVDTQSNETRTRHGRRPD